MRPAMKYWRSLLGIGALVGSVCAAGCDRPRAPVQTAQPLPAPPLPSVSPQVVATAATASPLDAAEPGEDLASAVKVASPEQPAPPPPPPPDNEPGHGLVIASSLNIRSGPEVTPSNRIGGLRCGDVVTISGKQDGWYQVQVDKLSGFAQSSFIFRMGPDGKRGECKPQVITVEKRVPPPLKNQTGPHNTTAEQLKDPAGSAAGQHATPEVGDALRNTGSDKGKTAQSTNLDRGASTIVLSQNGKKLPVLFTHANHQARYECAKCHHPVGIQNGQLQRLGTGTANDTKKCHSCHGVPGTANKARTLSEDAFHINCRDCHNALGSQAAKAPKFCKGCHR